MDNKITKNYDLPNRADLNELLHILGYPMKDKMEYGELSLDTCYAIQLQKGSELIGVAITTKPSFAGDNYMLYFIGILPEYQKQKFGTNLMNDILDWYNSLPENKAPLSLVCEISRFNFYTQFGFLPTSLGEMQYFPWANELAFEA